MTNGAAASDASSSPSEGTPTDPAANPPAEVARGSAAVDWTGVALFYGLACLISWPVFYIQDFVDLCAGLHNFAVTTGYMWGPGAAALICYRWWRPAKTVSLLGTSWRRSLIFLFAPLVALALAQIPIIGSDALALLGLLVTLAVFNTLGEELGWRGFLQDKLRPLDRVWRYVLIGVLWELWHFRFRSALFGDATLASALATEAAWIPATILFSALIGELTDRGRALAIAVALHAWINLTAGREIEMLLGASLTPLLIVLPLVCALWWWLLRTWPISRSRAGTGR